MVPWAHKSQLPNGISIGSAVLHNRANECDQQRHTDTQTDHATPSVAIARILSPVHTSNNVEATLSKQQATFFASTMLPIWATLSKQRLTLSKERNFNAKLVRHCCRFWQQSRTSLRHCC